MKFEMFVIFFLFCLNTSCYLCFVLKQFLYTEFTYDFGTLCSSYFRQQFWYHLNMMLLKYITVYLYMFAHYFLLWHFAWLFLLKYLYQAMKVNDHKYICVRDVYFASFYEFFNCILQLFRQCCIFYFSFY